MFKRKVQDKRDAGKGSGGKTPLPMRSAEQIIRDSKENPGMQRIWAFMRGVKPEPEDIFYGDYLMGDKPPKGTEFKLK